MEQLNLSMLTIYTGPRLVALEIVDACRSYHEAVCTAWELRTRRSMTKRQLAEFVGVPPSHLTDYLSAKQGKRDMPAKYVQAFELACGNRMVTQWMTRQASLTILEQYAQQPRRALA